MALSFTPCTQEDRASILSLELASFPEDEAADDTSLQLRLAEAGDFFYKLNRVCDGELLGFINGTCIQGPNLEHDSMTSHVKMGPILVIHSVTVRESERRKYYALYMLHRYISFMKQREELKEIRLLTKPLNMNLYLMAGFNIVGISPIVHGADAWFEMKLFTRTAYQLMVDAFAPTAFSGNPAAVVFEWGECREKGWMLKVASENNQSETAFVRPLQKEGEVYAITWFTPTKEVELCGHATLAAAAALYHTKRVHKGQNIAFETPKSGTLYAHQHENGQITLNFPETRVTDISTTIPDIEKSVICQAFGIQESHIYFVGRSIYDLVVEIKPEVFLAKLSQTEFDFDSVQKLGERGVLLTTKVNEQLVQVLKGKGLLQSFDIASRCFFPRIGIQEDAVTGSAHCALTSYWGDKLGKNSMIAYQASSRGGVLYLERDSIAERVVLGGDSIVVMQTKIL